MWPVLIKRLKLTADGETLASVDFFGGVPTDVDVEIHNLRKYESLFGRQYHQSISRIYGESILESVLTYRDQHGLGEEDFCQRCGVSMQSFAAFTEENKDLLAAARQRWRRRMLHSENND